MLIKRAKHLACLVFKLLDGNIPYLRFFPDHFLDFNRIDPVSQMFDPSVYTSKQKYFSILTQISVITCIKEASAFLVMYKFILFTVGRL